MIGIIPLGGNVRSVLRAFNGLVLGYPREAYEASRLILPGVGSFASVSLSDDWRRAVIGAAERGTPILGICLGMQFLGSTSEEGEGRGLGLIPGHTVKMSRLRIGWDYVDGLGDLYFCHGYKFIPDDSKHVISRASDGVVAIVRSGCVTGVQFHPEKSQRPGRKFIDRFIYGEEKTDRAA